MTVWVPSVKAMLSIAWVPVIATVLFTPSISMLTEPVSPFNIVTVIVDVFPSYTSFPTTLIPEATLGITIVLVATAELWVMFPP